MVVLQVIIFALFSLSYPWVQAKYNYNNVPIIDGNEAIFDDNVGIIGGKQVSIKEAPYVAALYMNREALGAGSIIHEQFILTAASVVNDVNDTLYVLVGTDRLSVGGQLIEVDEYLCHENYIEGPDNDICLLKLQKPVTLGPNVAKMYLPEQDYEFESGVNVNVTGWGMMEENIFPDHLRRTMVVLECSDLCADDYNTTMTDNMLCAGAIHRDACVGDGGAPLSFYNIQVGVMSFGEVERCGNVPSVYTKVSKFVFWIDQTISENL